MSNTDNLKLPYLAAGQAQKHVTLNESLRMLDALVHLSLKSRMLASPPSSPETGARYLIPASATGVWAGRTGQVAAWQDGAWAYFIPQPGWRAFVAEENSSILFNGVEWQAEAGSAQPDILGINAIASVTNRLTVKSPASLFDQEGGSHRLTINKAAIANTASTLFQTNYSGRAEFGLTGSDDFQLKTSPDGTIWADVLTFDKTTGLGIVKENPIAPLGIATKQYVDAQVAAQSGGGAGLPSGAIAHFAMSTPPVGWLKADGSTVSRTTYAALFAAIGTLYGAGNGTTTFTLPDLRGEFIRGWDDGRGVDTGRLFASSQDDAIRNITGESGPYYGPSANYMNGSYVPAPDLSAGALSIPPFGSTPASWGTLGATPGQSYKVKMDASLVVPTASENRPRNIALLVCIKT